MSLFIFRYSLICIPNQATSPFASLNSIVWDNANSPFVNHKGKDVHSDWLADQWDERSVSGHAHIHKGRMKVDDPEIDTAQTAKRLDGRLALLEKIRKTFTDSIPKKNSKYCTPLYCWRLLQKCCGAVV